MPHVVVTTKLTDTCTAWLEQQATVEYLDEKTAPTTTTLAGADGLVVGSYTPVDDALLERSPRLQVVGRAGVGLDNIDVDACRLRRVMVVHTPDANTQAVCEYVIALMLDAFRPRIDLTPDDSVDQYHAYRQSLVGSQLDTMTLGILGFGRIGRRLGRIAHAIGMTVHAHDLLGADRLLPQVDYPVELVPADTLYRGCDVLSIHVDGRRENRHLVDVSVLDRLKPTCLVINAARGPIVDGTALAAWARRHAATGARAVLDVHDPEPLPPLSPDRYPLYGIGNVRLLPHLASRTHLAVENMGWVVRDVVGVLEGRPATHPAW